jgi:hypothetical protein
MTFGKCGLPEFVNIEHRGPRGNPIRRGDEPVPKSLAAPQACRRFHVQKAADARDELFFRERYASTEPAACASMLQRTIDLAAPTRQSNGRPGRRRSNSAVRSRLPAVGKIRPITPKSIWR